MDYVSTRVFEGRRPIPEEQAKIMRESYLQKVENRKKWDNRFLELAKHYSTWSKDESTKVGCVVVNGNRTVVSSGYNGLPRGCRDDVAVRLSRPEKYFWFEHAERNAIFNAAHEGISLDGCTAYTTLCPCMDCARALVQSGIKRVVTYQEETFQEKWKEHFIRTEELFKECNVEINFI